jgi:signal transduction histidine kinase
MMGMAYPPWMRTGPAPTPERRARRSRRARLFAAALSVFVQLPGLAFALAGSWHHVHYTGNALTVSAVALGVIGACFLLLGRRRTAVIVVAALAVPAIALAPGPPMAGLAAAIAVARAVFGGASNWAWCTIGGVGLAGVGWIIAGNESVGGGGVRLLAVTILLCIVAAAASAASTRRERFRASARAEASRRRSAAEEERLRIARELHDVLAHSLSQISVQAGVGLHLFDDDPDSAKESLRSIRETSASALDEVRGVLGMLREPGDPAAPRRPEPGLSAVAGLLDENRRLGLNVQASGSVATGVWADNGAVSSAAQTAAYRIVQEALTNVRRHAGTSAVSVRAEADEDAVTLRIENGPPTTTARDDDGHVPGRGILGMRERAAALGGTLRAEATAGGGFLVEALLPARTTSGSGPSAAGNEEKKP